MENVDLTDLKTVFDTLYSIENLPEEFLAEDSPPSKDLESGLDDIPGSVLENVLNLEIETWLKDSLAPKTKFFRSLSVNEILAYDSDSLAEPFTVLDFKLHYSAVRLYKKILCYVEKRRSVKTIRENAFQALEMLFDSPQSLVDEAFVQTFHLLLGHPPFKEAVLSFLAVLSSMFAPSESLLNAILAYLFKQINALDDDEHCKYIFARLYATSQVKRNKLLSMKEIEFIEKRKAITLRLDCYGDKFILLPIESYFTVEMAVKQAVEMLQLPLSQHACYGISELKTSRSSSEEHFLGRKDNICEILAKHEKEANSRGKSFKLFLRLEIFFDHDPFDIDTLSYLVSQTQQNIGMDKFVCAEENAVELAGMYLVTRFKKNYQESLKFTQDRVEYLIPPSKFSYCSRIEWIEKVMSAYSEVSSTHPNMMRQVYFDRAEEVFGTCKQTIFKLKVWF